MLIKKQKLSFQFLLVEWEMLEKILCPSFSKALMMQKNYKNVEILWASTREPYNFLQAKKIGCHIITAPPSIIEKN